MIDRLALTINYKERKKDKDTSQASLSTNTTLEREWKRIGATKSQKYLRVLTNWSNLLGVKLPLNPNMLGEEKPTSDPILVKGSDAHTSEGV